MKKTINICGIGHKKGVTKAGKQYDFFVMSGTYADPDYTDGLAACELPIDPSLIGKIGVGMDVDVYSHFCNGKTYVDAVIPV